MMVWRASTNNCVFFIFDKPQYPISGWSNPAVFNYSVSPAGITATFNNYATLFSAWSTAGTTLQPACFTYESYANGTALRAATGIGTAVNTFSSEWPVLPIGIAISVNSAGNPDVNRGRAGVLFDLWWKPSGVSDADTFPNDANHRQYCAMADFVFPWTNDTTVAALT
jgi:hypothetical protein